MNNNFVNTNFHENISKDKRILDSNTQLYTKIKSNILELLFENNSLYFQNKNRRKHHSESYSKFRNKIQKKRTLNAHKVCTTKKIQKIRRDKENINTPNKLRFNTEDEKKPFLRIDFEKEKNKELKETEKNKNEIKDKYNILNENKGFNKDFIEKINNNTDAPLNKNDRANNDFMNINNNYSSNDISNMNNINQNLNIINYYSNNNTNQSNNNYHLTFFGLNNNQEDNSSLNSSKNESKNVKANNYYNRISNLSSSSYSKNFVLKSEVCKSTFHNEKRCHKNANSEDNPIISYYGNNMRTKNVGNFYLFTERKSTEDLEQNKNVSFFPLDDNSKKESKDIMNCNYKDNNIIISEKIDAEIINENYENNNEYNFNIKELHGGVNNEKEYNIKFIKNNFMKEKKNDNGNNNNNNKSTIEKNFEYDDINKIIDKKKDNVKNEIDKNNNNINNNNSSIDNNNKSNDKYDLTLNNNINNNIANNQNKIIENPQMPLTFISNIYNINNNQFKQFQANSIINQGMFNYYQNINPNPIMNYYNSNYQSTNYYQQLYNQNYNQFQNGYFKPINNLNNYDNINSNNNKTNYNISNSINNNNNNNIINMNNNISNDINNNIKTNFNNINDNSINQQLVNKNYYEYSEEEILNNAINLIKDQYGCRFIQEKIKDNNYFANELLFPRIKYNLKELCCDCFDNYFLQLMIDILSFDNINKFFDMTQNEFTEICISPHGTRVIQKIIDKISATPLLMNRFIYNLNSKDLGVIFKSPYGNHSIQKFLEITHSSEYSNFIFIYIYNNFLDITNSKHGVCVVQKCINEGDEKQRNKLYELILNNFNNIIKNEFGNYLIQYILINTKTEKKFKEILPLILKIEENMIDLCKSKYSANAIEKCFEHSENIIREHILDSLIKNYSENIIDILLDNYGIYVIQKAVKLKNSNYKNKIIEIINNKEKELKNINFDDYKYKNILKIINSHKELMEILSKYIKINNNNLNNNEKNKNNENNNDNNHNNKEEDNRNDYYKYNKGKNKRGRKFYRGKKNEF